MFGKLHTNQSVLRNKQYVDANTLWKHEFQSQFNPETLTALGPTAYEYDILVWLKEKNKPISVEIEFWRRKRYD